MIQGNASWVRIRVGLGMGGASSWKDRKLSGFLLQILSNLANSGGGGGGRLDIFYVGGGEGRVYFRKIGWGYRPF